jgi:hypothetical protein
MEGPKILPILQTTHGWTCACPEDREFWFVFDTDDEAAAFLAACFIIDEEFGQCAGACELPQMIDWLLDHQYLPQFRKVCAADLEQLGNPDDEWDEMASNVIFFLDTAYSPPTPFDPEDGIEWEGA